MTVPLVVARTAFLLLLALSLYLFLAPVTPAGPPGSDKVGHVAIFAVLALAGRWARLRPAPLLVGLAAYAALTEALQAALPLGRYGDPADLLADVVGVLLGLAGWQAALRVRSARRAARSPSPPPG